MFDAAYGAFALDSAPDTAPPPDILNDAGYGAAPFDAADAAPAEDAGDAAPVLLDAAYGGVPIGDDAGDAEPVADAAYGAPPIDSGHD